jgi:hypothetical protein
MLATVRTGPSRFSRQYRPDIGSLPVALLAAAIVVAFGSSVSAASQENPGADAAPSASPTPVPPTVLETTAPSTAPPASAPSSLPSSDVSLESPTPETSVVTIHGFASQGFILTTGNDYIAPDTTHGSFQLTEVGLNLTKQLTNNLRFGIQAFAQNFALGGNFDLKADWFYVDYRWRDWFGVRVGRLKIPFGFYNEVNDIDAARVPILLPQSTYPIQGRNFLFAQNGVELYGFARAGLAGALDYRLYFGTIFIDPAILVPPGSAVQLQLNVRYVLGGRVFWETPLQGLRIGASVLAVHLDANAFAAGMTIPIANQSLLSMASAEYATPRLIFTAEYALWHASQESPLPSSNVTGTSERSYAMLTYRATSWFHPALYYALYFRDVHNRDAASTMRQNDVSLTLRFDLNDFLIVKVEGHLMEGTADLVAPLSVTAPPPDPERVWGVFLLKVTGYF